MLIIPAIDLKDNKVVRYTKGKYNKKIYSKDPLLVAKNWQDEGAKLLHIVDLDGAFTGKQKNLKTIKKIIKAIKIPAEVGGGVRDLKTIKKLINFGAYRVILGTKAFNDPSFLKTAIKKYKNKIALSLDISGSRLGLFGWKKSLKINLSKLLEYLERIKLKTIIFTDISRDGTLKGINIGSIKKLLKTSNVNIIVSGGVSSASDIKKLAGIKNTRLVGVIIGKALYEKKINFAHVSNLLKNKKYKRRG